MAKSPNVATKHFRQVTDSLFEKAVQQASARSGTAPLSAPTSIRETPENAFFPMFSGVPNSGGGI
ncbi:MAG: hypothetical protein DWI22_19110 [Planctomycetota bacterium]|nr:MAG: hypothetical protein DWI22_19110 [Planctomycetota bacterium]